MLSGPQRVVGRNSVEIACELGLRGQRPLEKCEYSREAAGFVRLQPAHLATPRKWGPVAVAVAGGKGGLLKAYARVCRGSHPGGVECYQRFKRKKESGYFRKNSMSRRLEVGTAGRPRKVEEGEKCGESQGPACQGLRCPAEAQLPPYTSQSLLPCLWLTVCPERVTCGLSSSSRNPGRSLLQEPTV